jgi:hypothetical protein
MPEIPGLISRSVNQLYWVVSGAGALRASVGSTSEHTLDPTAAHNRRALTTPSVDIFTMS